MGTQTMTWGRESFLGACPVLAKTPKKAEGNADFAKYEGLIFYQNLKKNSM